MRFCVQRMLWLAIATCLNGAVTPPTALAQLELIPDTAPDRNLGTQVIQNVVPGVDVVTGGSRPQNGRNLFHSFQEFNIRENRGVYFNNPAGVQNILTRITGTDPSDLLGTLGVLGTANLFFINPNGILFGSNASLDLRGGSFYGTTASGVKFGDIGEFSAVNPQPLSNLLTVNPSAFFFTTQATGAIVNRSTATRTVLGAATNGLQVPNGQTLLLLGGPVTVDRGQLNAWSGRVEIGAVAASGTVDLRSNGSLSIPSEVQRADVTITNNSRIDTQLGDRGDIAITANNINVLNGSQLLTGIFNGLGTASSQAGDINLNATGLVQVTQFSRIVNDVEANATGNGGNLIITAAALDLRNRALFSASSDGTGNAGTIQIKVNQDVRLDGSSNIFSLLEQNGEGNAGGVEVSARHLTMTGGSQMSGATFGRGNAGNVILNVRDSISLEGSEPTGRFPSAIFSSVQGNAVGQGGDVRITTGSLSLRNSAKIDISVLGTGDGGNVIINARDDVTLDGVTRGFRYGSAIFSTIEENGSGSAGDIQIATGSLFVLNGAAIQSLTENQGNAGNILIDARDAVVVDGAGVQSIDDRGNGLSINILSSEIRSGAETGARGNAGNITIKAGNQILVNPVGKVTSGKILNENGDSADINYDLLSSRAFISSSIEENVVGQAGNIRLETGTLSASNDARIISITNGTGDAGNISVLARDSVLLDKDATISNLVDDRGIGNGGTIEIITGDLLVKGAAQIDSSTFGQGNAGDVIVEARNSVVFSGERLEDRGDFTAVFSSGILSTSERGQTDADAGNIRITTGTLTLTDGAELRTVTTRQGNAGQIFVQARGQVSLRDRGEINSNTLGQGNAGDITIQTDRQFRLDNDSSVTSSVASGAKGNGGSILVDAESVYVTNTSSLATTSFGEGNAGNVTVNTRGAIVFFDPETLDPAAPGSAITSGVGQFAVGNAGNIRINAESLSMLGNTVLRASTEGQGDAGGIFINSRDFVLIDQATVANLVGNVSFPGRRGNGNGNIIQIDTGTLSLVNGGQIQASTFGQGDAGDVVINARDRVNLDGYKNSLSGDRFYSAVFSVASPGSRGNGGDITVNTGGLTVLGGTLLSTSTRGRGQAGNIQINAKDFVVLDGFDAVTNFSSGLFSQSEQPAQGQGGSITVNTNSLQVSNRAVINAATLTAFQGGNILINANQAEISQQGSIVSTASSLGNAGNIRVNANRVQLRDRAVISTSTARSDGGDIFLDIRDLLLLRRGSNISTTAGTSQAGGNGGNISINAPNGFIVGVQSENSDITANAFSGSGGRVNINAYGIYGLQFRPQLTPFSDITASSTFGLSGIVTLNTPNIDPNRGLAQLPQNLIDTNQILANSCIVRDASSGGTFLITGTGGLPEQPGTGVPTFAVGAVRGIEKTQLQSPPTQDLDHTSSESINEVQGIYKLPDGQIVLSWECH